MMNVILDSEKIRNLSREIGMPIKQDMPVRLLTPLGGLKVGAQHFMKPLFAATVVARLLRHWIGSVQLCLSMRCRSALPPRYNSPLTDATDLFMRRATSGTERPCK
jgi:hypothetical protein